MNFLSLGTSLDMEDTEDRAQNKKRLPGPRSALLRKSWGSLPHFSIFIIEPQQPEREVGRRS